MKKLHAPTVERGLDKAVDNNRRELFLHRYNLTHPPTEDPVKRKYLTAPGKLGSALWCQQH